MTGNDKLPIAYCRRRYRRGCRQVELKQIELKQVKFNKRQGYTSCFLVRIWRFLGAWEDFLMKLVDLLLDKR